MQHILTVAWATEVGMCVSDFFFKINWNIENAGKIFIFIFYFFYLNIYLVVFLKRLTFEIQHLS